MKKRSDQMLVFNHSFHTRPIGKLKDIDAYPEGFTAKFEPIIYKQIMINILEVEEIKCSVCKVKFMPNTEFHYVAKGTRRRDIFSSDTDAVLYDAYDCPLCGCQILLGERQESTKRSAK